MKTKPNIGALAGIVLAAAGCIETDEPAALRAPCRWTQLLVNPTFDAEPAGAGWTALTSRPGDFIVTDQDFADAPIEDTAPYKAYMGGFDAVAEQLYQDVVIPADTQALVLTGRYHVSTIETEGFVFDQAKVVLISPVGAHEELQWWANTSATTGWTPFTASAGQIFAGQVTRVVFEVVTDAERWTSFLFDSLALYAESCS